MAKELVVYIENLESDCIRHFEIAKNEFCNGNFKASLRHYGCATQLMSMLNDSGYDYSKMDEIKSLFNSYRTECLQRISITLR